MTRRGRPVPNLEVSRAVGHVLYVLRRKRDWSRDIVRDLTGMSAASLDRWEKGESGITVDNLARLADVYRTRPETILASALAAIEERKAS